MKEHLNHNLSQLTSRILEIRYTDIEEEKRLCLELLEQSEKIGDNYGQAFAHTFLGDYFIAINSVEKSGIHLKKALDLSMQGNDYDELKLQIYHLSGIYYTHKADEQNSIQCYLDALAIAQKVKDVAAECFALNNIGVSFQRCNSFENALNYFKKAWELQKEEQETPRRITFISNLAETLIGLGHMEEALFYIRLCEETKSDPKFKKDCLELNWCLYYAKTGERAKSLELAEKILNEAENSDVENMLAFDNYNALFECMMEVKHRDYARRFLELMEKTSFGGGVDQQHILEKKRIAFVLQFEPEEKHFFAYRRFYRKMQEFKKQINHTIANAMKSKIQLDGLNRSKEALKAEQKNLQEQYYKDELTGIFNRRYLESLILQYSEGTIDGNLGVIMVDVDYFKEYNDYYNHIKGDEVLKIVSACLNDNKIEGISPCRFGGDEFTCVCHGITKGQIEEYVANVCADMEKRKIVHEKSLCSDHVTLSIGIAMSLEKDPHIALELADQALYESKQMGRNRVSWNRAEA